MGKKTLMLLLSLFIGIAAFAQGTVTGRVTSTEDGLPVIGASVFVQGTSNGTVTDADGAFTLRNVPAGASLVFSYIGMKDEVLPAASRMEVTLSPDTNLLN